MTSQDFPYEIIEEYVRGGCSVIYKIKPREIQLLEDDQIQYVLKTMSVADNDPQSYQRFYMEWEFLRAYPNPNLVKVKEYFKDWHGRPAYVMEWVEGQTWQAYFRDRAPMDDLQNFLNVSKQLCDALDFIHKHQIIHRDLKPQNVLVNKDDVVKLIDFGIMKVADLTMYTHRNTFMGSAYYVAPEGISGEQVNHTADIFALGVMLYDLFTGVKPFQGHTLGETIYQRLAKKPQAPSQLADLPEELDEIILRMLDREPRNRQQSCTEVFAALQQVFGRFVPDATADDLPEIDVLTKGPFFHGKLLKDCRKRLGNENLLFLTGMEGTGKTTLVENLCSRAFDEVLRLDCHSTATELSFMEAILKNMRIPSSQHRELKQWMEILGSVIPGLRWPTPHASQPISPGVVQTAFRKILTSMQSQTVVIIEDLHLANQSLQRFVCQLATIAAKKDNAHYSLILTSQVPLPEVDALVPAFEVQFPDILFLTDYLKSQFGGCPISIDVVQQLADYSSDNIASFVRLVQRSKAMGKLVIEDGVLTILGDLNDSEDNQGEAPPELKDFTKPEINALSWVALCPEVDVQTLRKVSGLEMAALGPLLERVNRLGLLEFQSSASDGFSWRNHEIKDYLISSLVAEERTSRYHTLAKTIEDQSRMFLSYSPPLWLVLCRLYQQAGDDQKASQYALDYARYCSQTANYGPVREILSPFISLPHFQKNQEFWSMLAMANKDEDIKGALHFAKKAAKIQEAPATLALLAILEYESGSYGQARNYLSSVMSKSQVAQLDVQYTAQLMPILMSLGQIKPAQSLYSVLNGKLKGRNDLFATNTLLLARARLLQPWPRRMVNEITKVKQELLPQTRRTLNAWCCRAYAELFDFEAALAEMNRLDPEQQSPEYFQEALFLFLFFDKPSHMRNLISLFRESERDDERYQYLAPVFHLATKALVKDPNVYDFEHVLQSLAPLKQNQSSWLALITTHLGLAPLGEGFLAGVLDTLQVAAEPFARYQIPRLRTWLEIKRGEQIQPRLFMVEAANVARDRGLISEQLRLYALHRYLATNLGGIPALNLPDLEKILESSNVKQFINAQYGES